MLFDYLSNLKGHAIDSFSCSLYISFLLVVETSRAQDVSGSLSLLLLHLEVLAMLNSLPELIEQLPHVLFILLDDGNFFLIARTRVGFTKLGIVHVIAKHTLVHVIIKSVALLAILAIGRALLVLLLLDRPS